MRKESLRFLDAAISKERTEKMTPNNPFDERSQKVSETISFKKPKRASREEAPADASEPEKETEWFEEDGSPIEEDTPKRKEPPPKRKNKRARAEKSLRKRRKRREGNGTVAA